MQDIADKCNAEMLEAVRAFREIVDRLAMVFVNSAMQASKELSARAMEIQLEFEAQSQMRLDTWRGEIKISPGGGGGSEPKHLSQEPLTDEERELIETTTHETEIPAIRGQIGVTDAHDPEGVRTARMESL